MMMVEFSETLERYKKMSPLERNGELAQLLSLIPSNGYLADAVNEVDGEPLVVYRIAEANPEANRKQSAVYVTVTNNVPDLLSFALLSDFAKAEAVRRILTAAENGILKERLPQFPDALSQFDSLLTLVGAFETTTPGAFAPETAPAVESQLYQAALHEQAAGVMRALNEGFQVMPSEKILAELISRNYDNQQIEIIQKMAEREAFLRNWRNFFLT